MGATTVNPGAPQLLRSLTSAVAYCALQLDVILHAVLQANAVVKPVQAEQSHQVGAIMCWPISPRLCLPKNVTNAPCSHASIVHCWADHMFLAHIDPAAYESFLHVRRPSRFCAKAVDGAVIGGLVHASRQRAEMARRSRCWMVDTRGI